MKPRILLIDNFDSFTYNLVQAFMVLDAEVTVFRNNEITVEQALDAKPTHLVISPGPGRPENAGISLDMVAAFEGLIPMLGVCLGHQCLVAHFGGEIVLAERLMHGKTSMVHHEGTGIYSGLDQPFQAGRYHSLAVDPESLPEMLEITARTDRGEIMGVQHRELPMNGVQFHPESILTPDGDQLMKSFLYPQDQQK